MRRVRRPRLPSNAVHDHKIENTYQLTPGDNKRFNAAKVTPLIASVLESHLRGTTYKGVLETSILCSSLSALIKDAVKTLGYARYKLVCNVIVGEVARQTMHIASRCVWDDTSDTSVTVCYEDGNFCVVAILHALYYE